MGKSPKFFKEGPSMGTARRKLDRKVDPEALVFGSDGETTFLTGIEIESIPSSTPKSKSLLFSPEAIIDPLETLWQDHFNRMTNFDLVERKEIIEHPTSLLSSPITDINETLSPITEVKKKKRKKRRKKKKRKSKKLKKTTSLRDTSIHILNRTADRVVSVLRRRKPSTSPALQGAWSAPAIFFRRSAKVESSEKLMLDETERRVSARNEAANRSLIHIRRMRAWEKEMGRKQLRLKWFKRRFVPIALRIQLALKRTDAFRVWKKRIIFQRAQGENLTKSLCRIAIFKAFRTWKSDTLKLNAIKHGGDAVQKIITTHKYRKFLSLWKIWNIFFRAKAATITIHKTTKSGCFNENNKKNKENVAVAFEGVSRAFLHAMMRLALRDWHTRINVGIRELRDQQRKIKLWIIVKKYVRIVNGRRAFDKWKKFSGMQPITKPSLRFSRPKRRSRTQISQRSLITELDKVNMRVKARVDASEEQRLKLLAKEIMRSPLTFPCDKDADRITVNIALPSGGIASLSQIPTFFKVDDILMALSTVQRKEVRLPKKLASRNQSPFGITVVLSGKPLRCYRIRSGATIFALLRLLSGQLPGQRNKVITAMDWVNGADTYEVKWKHIKGAKVCEAFHHHHDHDHDGENEPNLLWSIDDEGNHTYERRRTEAPQAPPVVFKVRVVDHDDELRNLHHAEVDLIHVDTNKVVRLETGLVRSTVIEESGFYKIVARFKAHTQKDFIEKFYVDRYGRKKSEWELPVSIVCHLEFLPSVRVRVREGSIISNMWDDNSSHGSNDRKFSADLSATCIEMKASDGSLVEMKQDFGDNGYLFVGRPKIPNSYTFVSTLANFQQQTLRTPVHFSIESWLAECDTDGCIDFEIVMALQPKIVVDCVYFDDETLVLPEADVDLITMPITGSCTKPNVKKLGKGIFRSTEVDCSLTYCIKASLPNYEQVNYLDSFTLPSSAWPVDGPLRLTVRMIFKSFLRVGVYDIESGLPLDCDLRIIDRMAHKEIKIAAVEWDHGHVELEIDCPGRYTLEGKYLNYEQVKPVEVVCQQTNYPKDGILKVSVPMKFVDPAVPLFGGGLGKDVINPLFILDVSASTSSGHQDSMLEKVKNAMTVVLSERYCLSHINIVAFSATSRCWRPRMAVTSNANRKDAAIFVAGLRSLKNSHFVNAFDKGTKCGEGADRIYFVSCGEPSDEGALAAALAMSCNLGGIPIDTLSAPSTSDSCVRLLQSISHRTGGVYRSFGP